MTDTLSLAANTLISPAVLSFALGFGAAMARSSLSVPEAAAKALAIYLLFAIGFKGGAAVAAHGADTALIASLVAGAVLSAIAPLVAFAILRAVSGLDRVTAAAVAAHYGSISIVTFVASSSALASIGVAHEGFMVAVAAAMEAPAIFTALILARGGLGSALKEPDLLREVAANGSIVLLVGAFLIGWVTGPAGLEQISGLVTVPFTGLLCLFLLDMGIVAGRGLLRSAGDLTLAVVLFGVGMPLIGAALGLVPALLIGLSPGGVALFMTLSASASYIAVPAAMRVALPEADPAISLTLSLGVTFPFNLTLGIPLYIAVATAIVPAGGG